MFLRVTVSEIMRFVLLVYVLYFVRMDKEQISIALCKGMEISYAPARRPAVQEQAKHSRYNPSLNSGRRG